MSQSATRRSAPSHQQGRPIRRRAGSGDKSLPGLVPRAGAARAHDDRAPSPGQPPAPIPCSLSARNGSRDQLPGEQLEVVSRDEPRGHLVRWQRACLARYLRTNRIERQPGGGLVAPEDREYRGIAIRSAWRRDMPKPVGKEQPDRPTAPLGFAKRKRRTRLSDALTSSGNSISPSRYVFSSSSAPNFGCRIVSSRRIQSRYSNLSEKECHSGVGRVSTVTSSARRSWGIVVLGSAAQVSSRDRSQMW